MTDSATSLDRLHDIVLPAEIPWWPPAPGWYVVLGIALILVLVLVHRSWKQWQANAYRRIALRALASAPDASSIAELLRRTALAIAPRGQIATLTGTLWLDWLTAQSPRTMPDAVRRQLTTGLYARPEPEPNLTALRDYAAHWIAHHHRPPPTVHASQC